MTPAGSPVSDTTAALPLRVGGWLLLIFLLAAVGQIDVREATMGIRGDEATYVSMAASLAYDHDLKFTRTDLDRFWRLTGEGPNGIFLKQGRTDADGLDYGKSFAYPVLAAPFLLLLGMRGLLLLNVLLLALVVWCGARLLRARGAGPWGPVFALAFVAASVVPIYAVWRTPEVFNFALVFLAYFLWLYKEADAAATPAWLAGRASDLAAAALLGIATFSKPTNALLILPVILLALIRRRWARAAVVAVAFVVVAGGLFAVNAGVSGDWNYQGGNRRTFYGRFPYATPDATFASLGTAMTTNAADTGHLLAPHVFWSFLGHNAIYFFVGRDAGLIPYFFPGVVALVWWMTTGGRRSAASWLVLIALFASVLALLVLVPDTWNGAGGPPGGRYFLSLYAAMFFFVPARPRAWPALVAWTGGLLFVAPMLASPFAAAKYPWHVVETGLVRRLPVELTLLDDLPVALVPARSRVPFGAQRDLLLYFLDEHAFPPEGSFFWVAGGATAEVVVRAERPLAAMQVTWQSPIANHVTARIGASTASLDLVANREQSASLRPGPGVVSNYKRGSRAYVLRLSTSTGFVPRLADPRSTDRRFLGARVELQVTY
ncbi:MAG TPA: hypothetical protein VFX12_13000 [Vicinamibacterales bacterium]|nr:hypothetical protein [Vicinamibacterales bacterium]